MEYPAQFFLSSPFWLTYSNLKIQISCWVRDFHWQRLTTKTYHVRSRTHCAGHKACLKRNSKYLKDLFVLRPLSCQWIVLTSQASFLPTSKSLTSEFQDSTSSSHPCSLMPSKAAGTTPLSRVLVMEAQLLWLRWMFSSNTPKARLAIWRWLFSKVRWIEHDQKV